MNDCEVFLCYQEIWKTANERANAVYQSSQSEAVRKIRINAGEKGQGTKDVAIGAAYNNLFGSPLNFEKLELHMPLS